ncbi:MAG: polysaccharide deacetylase [Candidatus Bathyarchaeia archaeon]|jgi:peptidoglycan/xylan/chitin deacetylase (PgdA/CDA1 family)
MVKRKGPFTVLLTFDLDADSWVGFWGTHDEPVAHSKGRFGPKVGLPRILTLLDKYCIKSTFFVPGWTAETYPESVKAILEHGHEIAAHGYKHESLREVKSQAEEIEIFKRSIRALEKLTGKKPLGFRAPFWEFSLNTISNLSAFKFSYDSSLMDDDKPYVIESEGRSTGIVELPVAWLLDDWGIYEDHRKSPRQAFENWISEFYALYAFGGSFFNLTMHPQVTGRASRVANLENLIRVMKKKPVTFSTCKDIAESFASEASG